MEKQSADVTKACTSCHQVITPTEDAAPEVALAADAEGLCIACYVAREAAIRKAARAGFRFGR